MMDQNIAQVKLLIDQQGVAGVLPQPLEDLENDLLDLEQILTKNQARHQENGERNTHLLVSTMLTRALALLPIR